MNTIILIDGDNIDESYTRAILEEVGRYVEDEEHFEIHCFGDFVKKKQTWRQSCYEYGVQLHYVPGMDKQKGKPDPNTSDIALTGFAVKKLYEKPELELFIIVANDKDYVPLAKIIMEEFNKKAVLFYSEPNDTAALCYSEAVLLKSAVKTETQADFETVSKLIADLFKMNDIILLAELAPILKENGVKYGKSVGKYLEKLFNEHPDLKKQYVLTLGDKKDRIELVA